MLTANQQVVIRQRGQTVRTLRRHWQLLVMLVPVVAYYLIFHYWPMYGIVIAFKDFKVARGILGSSWTEPLFKHFITAYNNPQAMQALGNTIIISVMKLLFTFPAPIVLALLLNEVRNRYFKRVVQTFTYLPHFLSWVVLSGIFIQFFSSNGPINAIIQAVGGTPKLPMHQPGTFRWMLVLSSLWKEVGWGTIIYLASLSNVDSELYEAAVLDGAGRFQQTLHVTLPAISPVVVIMLIFAIGGLINDDFDQIYNMTNPAVFSVSDVLSTFVYRTGLQEMRFSYSTAVGLFKNVVAFALIMMTNGIARRISDYGLW